MPIPDLARFNYRYRDSKEYVVGQFRIQEFDLVTQKWSVKSIGYSHLNKLLPKEPEETHPQIGIRAGFVSD